MCALQTFAPQFVQEGRLCWLRSPLWIVKAKNKEFYYFDDNEYQQSSVKGEVVRCKGLGSLSEQQARSSMFTKEFQRLDKIEPDEDSIELLHNLMGDNVEYRKEYIFKNVDFGEMHE